MKMITVDSELPALQLESAVVKGHTFRTLCNAADLLSAAREKADAIIKSAEDHRESERQKGYREGLEAGQREAAIHHLKTVEQTLAYLEEGCDAIVGTVMQCLRALINEFPPEEKIRLLASKALETLKHQDQVTLRVHPDDFDSVSQSIADLPISRVPLKVAISEGVPNGGCWLESPMGVVDATLDVQLAALSSVLRKAL